MVQKKLSKIGGFVTVWMYAYRNILLFSVFCNIKQSEITFKIVVKLATAKNALYITSSSRASRGRKFQKKKELYSKGRICV